MIAERNPIRREAARVRCSGVSVSAEIVVTPQSQTASTSISSDRLPTAIGLSTDCAAAAFAVITHESRLPFVALRLLFQKFFRFFYCPNIECWNTTNMRRLIAYSSSRILSASPNVGRNTLSFFYNNPI